jgi:hypothetical protein
VVGQLPWTARLDVAGATLDALESGLATDCGFPATDRAVWYRVDDPDGLGFVADASRSDHPVGIAVLGGDPRDNVLMGCSRGSVLTASGGPTGPVYVAILSDAHATSHVAVDFHALVAAPAVAATLDSVGTLDAGAARLAGTYSCSGSGAVTVSVAGSLAQGADLTGIASPADGVCDGALHPWSLVVSGPSAFQPGPAQGEVTVSACAGAVCTHETARGPVTLSSGA